MNFEAIKHKDLSVIYITSRDCNVCKSIFPNLEKLISGFPKSEFYRVETDEFPQVAGEFMIFTVPALLIYSQGKELYRAARFIKLQEVEELLENYYDNIFQEGEL